MRDVTLKSSSYKMGSMFTNIGRKLKKTTLILHNTLNYIVLVFCILLLKADFIMTSVAHVNDVAYGPLFYSLDSS